MSQQSWSSQPAPQIQQPLQPPKEALASWGQRVGAYLLDFLVILPPYIVAIVGISIASSSGSMQGLGFALAAVGYIASIGIAIWNYVFRQGRTGYSLGKQALGIRLVSIRDGQPIGPGLTFVRGLAHILDSLPLNLGYLWPLWDDKRQTFADKVMSTVVARQKKDA